jgi:hypothetical protein
MRAAPVLVPRAPRLPLSWPDNETFQLCGEPDSSNCLENLTPASPVRVSVAAFATAVSEVVSRICPLCVAEEPNAGASITLDSHMPLAIDSGFRLRDQFYPLDSGLNVLTFITDPIVLPEAQCTATPCPLPTITVSVPFTMTGDLVITDDKHTFDVTLRGAGVATGTLISPSLPPETGWYFIALSYDFTDPHGPPTFVMPEPTSVLLLGSGLVSRVKRSIRLDHTMDIIRDSFGRDAPWWICLLARSGEHPLTH